MSERERKYPKLLHDLNNQLMIVQGYSDLLLDTIPSTDARHADLMEIVSAAKHAIELVPQIEREMREGPA